VLLFQPRYAILDEATSALDSANEAALRLLLEAGTTLISIAHRAAVVRYHTQVLELTGDTGWRLHSAVGYHFRQ
jgi:putative ATP-binding cassette transporter